MTTPPLSSRIEMAAAAAAAAKLAATKLAGARLAPAPGKAAETARVRSPLVTAYGSGAVGEVKARGDGVDRVTLTRDAAVGVGKAPVAKQKPGVVKVGVPGEALLRGGVVADGAVRDGVVRDGVVRAGVVRDGAARGSKPIGLGGMIDVQG